ncbi:hypothetical protein KY284_012958 [Solanum tuberosum]|nr:hypothetical protein KY284_012958 [Solanum tuberosum]
MEPFQEVRQIHKFKRRLGMHYANLNQNGKIWIFVQEHVQMGVISDTEQQISLQLHFQETGQTVVTTAVYAKCDAQDRQELWDDIYCLSSSMTLP